MNLQDRKILPHHIHILLLGYVVVQAILYDLVHLVVVLNTMGNNILLHI
jgi:hypothetical protein